MGRSSSIGLFGTGWVRTGWAGFIEEGWDVTEWVTLGLTQVALGLIGLRYQE